MKPAPSAPSARRLSFVTLLIASLLFSATAIAAESTPENITLRPRFVAGRTTKYEVWSLRKQNIAMSFMGENQKMESVLETQGEVTWRVDRVNADGSATCTMTLNWLTATSKSTDADPIHVDSRKAAGDNPEMHALVKAMSGAPIAVEISADGTVTKVKGVDAIHAKLADATNAPDELDFQETAADLATITAAQEKIALNRNWKHAADWNHELGKMHHDTTYTLNGVEQVADIPIATVTGVSKLRLDLDKEKLPDPAGPKVEIKLKSGEATTQIMFDLSRGEAVGRNSIMNTNIEARLTHNGQTLTRIMDETVQSQSIRIAEK